jgi:hypothetical protein
MRVTIPPLPQYAFMVLYSPRNIEHSLCCYVIIKLFTTEDCMRSPRVADGSDGLQIWRIDANILNKESRIAEKGCTFILEVETGTDTAYCS